MNADQHLEIRKELDQFECRAVRQHLAQPVDEDRLHALRYVLSFARMTLLRKSDGEDSPVGEALSPHRWRVIEATRPFLGSDDKVDLEGALRVLPTLQKATIGQRGRLLDAGLADRDSLEAEVTQRQLVLVSGGGGGGGYGYPGVFKAMHRAGLQPQLMAGTSIGAIMSLFRSRYQVFDLAPMVSCAERLTWNTVFRVLNIENRYGLPATLRLYLRSALGSFFERPNGHPMTFDDLEVPLLVVATGLTVNAMKHDLNYYEHFLDDAIEPGGFYRRSRLRRIARLIQIFREFMAEPSAMREVVFGRDDVTMGMDVLDAVGFSCAVPGLIHYDVLREDGRMTHLLDLLYAEYGITRLTDGGLTNNVPARPAYEEVMNGRITRRNPFLVGLDCFSPRRASLIFYPLQTAVRPNVRANRAFLNLYMPLERRLPALNLVPGVERAMTAMIWSQEQVEPDIPWIQMMCTPIPVLTGS